MRSDRGQVVDRNRLRRPGFVSRAERARKARASGDTGLATRWRRSMRQVGSELAGERQVFGQSLVALGVNSTTSFVAGAVLAGLTGTFEAIPGLLVLVPAAIGLRGNVFSAFGSRLSTASHLGTLQFRFRADTVLGQNVLGAMALTFGMSAVLAVLASVITTVTGVVDPAPVADLALVSILGGLLASAVVLVAAIGLAVGSVRFEWDLDNLVAPVVSTLGDVLTLPALWVATLLVGHGIVTEALGWILLVGSVVACVVAAFSSEDLGSIVRQSLPVLLAAGVLSSLAGMIIEGQLTTFADLPALLVLYPAFVSSAGAIGGIVSSRLATKLHTGTVAPSWWPSRVARLDLLLALCLALPVCIYNAIGSQAAATIAGQAGPGIIDLLLSSVLAGVPVAFFVLAVAHLGTVAATRLEADPDNYGVPLVTSSVDLVGALALVLVFGALGLA